MSMVTPLGRFKQDSQSLIDQSLQVYEIDDFLEEMASLKEIQKQIESEYSDLNELQN